MNQNYIWLYVGLLITAIIATYAIWWYKKKKDAGKTIEEFYDNGQLRRSYFVDKNGFKQGTENFYFRNGKINKDQNWVDNHLEGESKVYYSTGELYLLSFYNNNNLDGDFKVYGKDGTIFKHETYENGSCINTLQDIISESNFEENSRNLISASVLDRVAVQDFELVRVSYQEIKKAEETKDDDRNKKGFLPGITKIGKVVSGVQAYQNRESSVSLKRACENYYDGAQKVTETARENLNKTINTFGKYRLETLHETTGRFLGILKDMNKENRVKEYEILDHIGINTESIKKMERLDMEASKALKSTATVGTLGAAAAMGTPALVTSTVGALATASTGTAISSLSGVAATNATLAWLGGGSLASGGGGMAAGATVLSGITMGATAGIGLVAAGLIASTYYSKKLTETKEYQKTVEKHVVDMEKVWTVLDGIKTRTDELSDVTEKLGIRLKSELDYLEPLAVDFTIDNLYYNMVFQRVGLLAKSMSELAQTPLLDDTGNTSNISAQIIQNTKKILNTKIINHD